MLLFPGGRYPQTIDKSASTIIAAVVNGEIHGRGGGLAPDEWVFMGKDGPLKVENEPFTLRQGEDNLDDPDLLFVRLRGEDGISAWASIDDCQTWWSIEEYQREFHQARLFQGFPCLQQ